MRLAAPPGMSRVNIHPPPRALAPEPSLVLHHWSDSALREAEHAEAAGHTELAAERYVEAANHAVKIGGCVRAIDLVERALRLLDHATPAAIGTTSSCAPSSRRSWPGSITTWAGTSSS